ncbi:MAG: hypothetical protein WA687_06810 [Solirubrobacterales bacterium]
MNERSAAPLAIVASSDKAGIEELGKALHEMEWRIVGTGGTVARLQDCGVPAETVDALIEMPELFGGRVKTLHQDIFAGLLYRRGNAQDEGEVSKRSIASIDLVACTFYSMPAESEARVAPDDLPDHIDIGGPAMVRAAAKSHRWVLPLVDPADYEPVATTIRRHGGRPDAIGIEERRRLAAKAFRGTAAYDKAIADRLSAPPPA